MTAETDANVIVAGLDVQAAPDVPAPNETLVHCDRARLPEVAARGGRERGAGFSPDQQELRTLLCVLR